MVGFVPQPETNQSCQLSLGVSGHWCGPDVKLLREFRNDHDPTTASAASGDLSRVPHDVRRNSVASPVNIWRVFP
jgi:hypothetical protein